MTVVTRQMRKSEQEIIEASQILLSMKKENIMQRDNLLKREVIVNVKNGQTIQQLKFNASSSSSIISALLFGPTFIRNDPPSSET